MASEGLLQRSPKTTRSRDNCEVIQRFLNSIASQVRNFERPPDRLLATKYDECLFVAFGKNETAPDINGLIGQIEEIALQLEQDCRELLEIAPSIAVTYPICKNILLIP